jgi:sugar phosphate isomerase/epimerase
MGQAELLFSTAAFFGKPLDGSFRRIAEAGYDGVEVMVTKDPASQEGATMRRLAQAHGLRVRAIHAPALLVTRRVWGADPVGKIERAIHEAHDAEVPLVVMHPPFRWQQRYRRWVDDELPGIEAKAGVIVAMENMFPLHVGSHPIRFHANADLDQLEGLPDLVLDTSHTAVARHDLLEVRRRFGDRLRHVHLSDNAGRGWDSHLPPGHGVLPLDRFLDDLRAAAFAGTVSLEVDLRTWMREPSSLRRVMVEMRERVEGRLADR